MPSSSSSLTIEPLFGFHSHVILNLKVANPSSEAQRFLMIVLLTKDFIADPFELARIDFGPNVLEVKTIGKVDLEVPSNSPLALEHAVLTRIQLHPPSSSNLSLKIPFHLRYQPPSFQQAPPGGKDEDFVPVKFLMPLLFEVLDLSPSGKCSTLNYSQIPEPFLKYIPSNECLKLKSLSFNSSIMTGGASSTNPKIIFNVPVGNAAIESQVKMATFAISILGVLMVLYQLLQKKMIAPTLELKRKQE